MPRSRNVPLSSSACSSFCSFGLKITMHFPSQRMCPNWTRIAAAQDLQIIAHFKLKCSRRGISLRYARHSSTTQFGPLSVRKATNCTRELRKYDNRQTGGVSFPAGSQHYLSGFRSYTPMVYIFSSERRY